jgi:regulator of RNase E activity RraA
MSDKLGLRIVTRVERPPRESFAGLLKVTTGNACDAMDRGGAMDWRIKPIDPSSKCVGTAITVKARPCDNLMIYKALEIAEPGDVIVIALGGYTGASTWGDLTSLIAKERGLAGMVTDGLVRDSNGIRDVGLPVWALGTIPSSPFKDGPGEVNVPISCGGVLVRPGDVIFGDVDGVVVIPREQAAEVTRGALAVDASEVQKVRDIKAGKLIPGFVDTKLRELGYSV